MGYAMRGVFICAAELEALHSCSPLAGMTYLWLRSFADLRSGVVGRTRPVSLSMLRAYTETHTPRGSGVQITQPSERGIRTALSVLERAGLLRRLADDRRLIYLLPRMETLSLASRKPDANPTGKHGAEPDTGDNSSNASAVADLIPRHWANSVDVSMRVHRPNLTHIRGQRIEPSPPQTASTPEPGLDEKEGAAAAAGSGRCKAIANLLRGAGVRVIGNETELINLADVPKAEVLAAVDLARQNRLDTGSTQPIGLKFVVALLDRVQQQSIKAPAQAWWSSEASILAKGAELGLSPRPGEDWASFRARLQEAIMQAA